MSAILKLYNYFVIKINCTQPVVLFLLRLCIAYVFFISGLVKIGDFGNTVALFETEYAVPLIPPYFAAVSATFFELVCPVLLVFGFAGRLATLPLIAMTAVIQFTYDQNIQHLYWAIMLLTILAFGAGKISIDYVIYKKFAKN